MINNKMVNLVYNFRTSYDEKTIVWSKFQLSHVILFKQNFNIIFNDNKFNVTFMIINKLC